MNGWPTLLADARRAGVAAVRVTVAATWGSVPREAGATLVAWQEGDGPLHSCGTIGGGHLEARALEIAGRLLVSTEGRRAERFSLGAALGQCCGGAVELFWERIAAGPAMASLIDLAPNTLRYCTLDGGGAVWCLSPEQAAAQGLPVDFAGSASLVRHGDSRLFAERLSDERTPLWLYGAGHVGRALVRVLTDLPFSIRWIDSRAEQLPASTGNANVLPCLEDDPADVVAAAAAAPAGVWHLVMTHSHDLDLQICEAVLRSGHFAFLGLIGSATKNSRFRHRLRERGIAADVLARLVCPVGIAGLDNKQPAAVALAIAAQLLQRRASAAAIIDPLLTPIREATVP